MSVLHPKIKALVLLSGGLDSTFNLYQAVKRDTSVAALFFDYGQRAARSERRACRMLCRHLRVQLIEIKLPWLKAITDTALVNSQKPLPQFKPTDLDRASKIQPSARAVWVPNRNGVFIQIAACYADAWNIKRLVVGFNREEAATFPDNSVAFVRASNAALRFSAHTQCRLESFSLHMDKKQIVRAARRLGFDLTPSWSCYETGPKPCGRCESCQRRKRAFGVR